jgi:pSer/pThr/pTyr-binding forkhead associated (FHA) protein
MPKLTSISTQFSGQSCELPDGRIAVGRGSKNQLVVSDESVSSKHCELLVNGNEVIVHELGSRNGSFVNGVRVQTQLGVKHGQTIRLGKVDFRLELDNAEEESDASTVTAVFVMRPPKALDHARPVLSGYHHTFAPIGAPIPESMTMFIPKVREEPPAPAFALPEANQTPARKKSILVPVSIVLAIGLLVIAFSVYLANR